jgi:hypothetical protein
MHVRGGIGDADLLADVYGPLFDALAAGPASVRQLLAEPTIAALGWNRLMEALVIVVGTGQVQPCLRPSATAKAAKTVKAFNRAVLRRARDTADLAYLASPVTGGGLAVPRFNQLFLLAIEQGRKTADECAEVAWQILSEQGQMIVKDGATLSTPEENQAELRAQAANFFARQLPVLRTLQAV